MSAAVQRTLVMLDQPDELAADITAFVSDTTSNE
jgi:hypothetical protein